MGVFFTGQSSRVGRTGAPVLSAQDDGYAPAVGVSMEKTQLADILVAPDATILDAVRTLDRGAVQLVLVVDEDRRLLGTVTDGDIRRGLMRGVTMDKQIWEVMNPDPASIRDDQGRSAALTLMRRRGIHHVPVIDAEGRVVRIEWFDEIMAGPHQDTWVALMVGGMGTRLRPLTQDIPKPMIPVGGRPLLETIIASLAGQGYRRFFLCINYLAEMIRDHLGDGRQLGVEITYIEERERMGTAGPLSLLPERPPEPLLVMNGDLLTAISFNNLVAFHKEHRATATMGVREYSMQVPYGVVRTEGSQLLDITEKPEEKYFVNAGIYVLEPEVLDMIPKGEFYDMPDLFHQVINEGGGASVFPIREYWLDIGRFDDLERARAEYEQIFGH